MKIFLLNVMYNWFPLSTFVFWIGDQSSVRTPRFKWYNNLILRINKAIDQQDKS